MGVTDLYPEWTEPEVEETGAIQHLRLNELRDHVNEVIFPYLTTIMPFFRLVSWLVWIYYRIDFERESSTQGMQYSEYKEKAARYYGMLATADVLHARFSGIEHKGPVGVEALSRALDRIGEKDVDFSTVDFGSTRNPVGDYKNGIINMGLLIPMLQPVSGRREETILVPTERGIKLASVFQDRWTDLFDPEVLVNKLIWSQKELGQLGESICLQGLSKKDEEANLLFQSARSSLGEPRLYDGFVDLTLNIARIYKEIGLMFKAEDVARASFYWATKEGESFRKRKIPESESSSLLAYHELHTHASYGADAILSGIVKMAKCYPGGIPNSTLVEEACLVLNKNQFWRPSLKHQDLIKKLKDNSSQGPKRYQILTPSPNGPYGFETIQNYIDESDEKPQALIAWGGVALFQAACAQEFFEKGWLRKILPHHREVFASYSFLEELQMLPSDATIRDWITRIVNNIIEQHSSVADSKGSYSRRIEKVGKYVHYIADAGYYRNRGRFPYAISWLSDVGLLQRKDNEYSLALEKT